MNHLFSILSCCIGMITALSAQQPAIVQSYIGKPVKHYIMPDSANLYVQEHDSGALFYDACIPRTPLKGVLMILPGTWESTEDVLSNNGRLAALCYEKGIMIIVPSLNYNLYIDDTALLFLNNVFSDVFKRYDPPRKVVIGGFSLGGMNAIRYTEIAYQPKSGTAVKPVAVYGIDPPLDLKSLYNTFSEHIRKNVSPAAVNEARSYVERMDAAFGGSPARFPEKYAAHSMYSHDKPQGGNAIFLRHVPVRVYSDPDIDWYLQNRKVDLYDMNALNQTAMINMLQQMGNERASFINALGKGIRPNGVRHPHSWSIADPDACFYWIMSCMD